jgi:polyhydroxyalkanoate synthase
MMPRLGPRPLPLHLTTAGLTWLSSSAAWPLLRHGSIAWKPQLRDAAQHLERSLEDADLGLFAKAVDRGLRRRFDAFVTGVLAYRRHPYRRAVAEPPTAWQDGSTRLLDYGGTGRPVLVVPSLVNRAYILDLSEKNSLLRYLAGRDLRPFLVDWGRTQEDERHLSLTDYIAGRLEAALDRTIALAGGPLAVLGYCMGGQLALALAQRRSRDVSALALLATPWDFHAEQPPSQAMLPLTAQYLSFCIDTAGELPTDVLQSLFYGLDPYLVIRKFQAFSRLDPASPKAEAFVALEDWLNDGVPLTGPVARECISGWYVENTPARLRWRVAARVVDPAHVSCRSFVVIPARDRIVPPPSAEALARALPTADVLRPTQGHIGMVVGGGAERAVWRPLAEWLSVRGHAA